MSSLQDTLHLAWSGMTLRDDAYRAMAARPRPVSAGLLFVVVIGLLVAVAALVGAVLGTWTSPDPEALRDAIWQGIEGLSLEGQIPDAEVAQARETMRQIYDAVWRVVAVFWPSIPRAAAGLLLTPLLMVVRWLVFGALAFAFARLFGGRGSLSETLGATALVVSPQLLGIVHALPGVSATGLGIWSLVCGYMAVKHAHGLSPGRAFWATVLPVVAVVVVIAAAVGLGVAVALLVGAAGEGGL
jgi:hypothetical protein